MDPVGSGDWLPGMYFLAILLPIVGVIASVRRFYKQDIGNGFGLLVTSLTVICVWAFLLTTEASASVAATDPQINAYVQVATTHFGPLPQAPNGPDVEIAELLSDPTTWAATVPGGDTIWLDPTFYPRPANLGDSYYSAQMCSIIVHEYGHLTGLAHVSDPQDIMNPTAPLNTVPGCPTYSRTSTKVSALKYKGGSRHASRRKFADRVPRGRWTRSPPPTPTASGS